MIEPSSTCSQFTALCNAVKIVDVRDIPAELVTSPAPVMLNASSINTRGVFTPATCVIDFKLL